MLNSVANLVMGRLPAYTRKRRHLQLFWRYASPQKLANLARAELSLARGDVVVGARPYVYTFDTGNLCNLGCPLCPTGVRTLERRQALMSFETFGALLEKVAPFAIEMILHNWGEPFLNPDILQMIRSAKIEGIGTTVSSNLNLVNRGRDFLEEVVESGLDHLTVSLDGTTQEVYQTYRKGGDIHQVLENLSYLISYRERKGSRTPVVEWQFLVMKHNQHQIEGARALAREMRVDRLRFAPAGLPFDQLADVALAAAWLPDLPQYRNYDPEIIRSRGYLYGERCFYLYRGMTVNPFGEVSPCCAVYHSKWDFGDLMRSGLDQVWNNEHYRASRALFSRKSAPGAIETVCVRCPLFKLESRQSPGC